MYDSRLMVLCKLEVKKLARFCYLPFVTTFPSYAAPTAAEKADLWFMPTL